MTLRRRILIADDNATDVETWIESFSDFNCDTDVATDGANVLDRVAQFRPHLMLLNPTLPKISGYDIYRHERRVVPLGVNDKNHQLHRALSGPCSCNRPFHHTGRGPMLREVT